MLLSKCNNKHFGPHMLQKEIQTTDRCPNFYPDDVNRTGSAIEPIERNRTVEIRLSNAIESQSNGQILGNYSIGSIEIRLRSIEILRSILGSIMFDLDLIVLCLIEIRLRLISGCRSPICPETVRNMIFDFTENMKMLYLISICLLYLLWV